MPKSSWNRDRVIARTLTGEMSASFGDWSADPTSSVCEQRPFWMRFLNPVVSLEGTGSFSLGGAAVSRVWLPLSEGWWFCLSSSYLCLARGLAWGEHLYLFVEVVIFPGLECSNQGRHAM